MPAPVVVPAPNDGDYHEVRERQIYAIINNGGFDLSRDGNQGRYTRCHHFRIMEDWDAIFNHLTGVPTDVYDTADYLYNIRFSPRYEAMVYDAFPEIVLIPLPQISPHFHRVVLHVECVNPQTNRLIGQFVPLLISYHENHPISAAITRLFHVEAQYAPIYQTNESLALLTFYQPIPVALAHAAAAANRNFPYDLNHVHVEQMCRYLIQPGNDFAAFDVMRIDASTFVLPDPALVARARREIVVPDYDDDPIGAREANERWLDVVYPDRFPTEQQRREMYTRYAAEQINIHRRARIKWARDFPYIPNPYVLPRMGVGVEQERENNPADRLELGEMNEFIQQLWDGQNDEDHARILLMMENIVANEHVIPVVAAAAAEPVFVHV